VDLNADVGEGVDGDDALLDVVTSASVACGVHAGDTSSMRRTAQAAAARGVVIGAHPSYPDRAGFGRRPMDLSPERITEGTLAQVRALQEVARAVKTEVRYVKPHGALYNRMADDPACARAVADAVRLAGDLVLLVPAGSSAVAVALAAGVRVATEAFADRAYAPDGRLVPRRRPGSVITDAQEVTARALSIALDHVAPAVDGSMLTLDAASICVHGDTPGAARLARSVREGLVAAGLTLRPFAS
jgi:UPF0271 protein